MVEMNNATDNMVGAPVPGRLTADVGVRRGRRQLDR
jgi:hypothetical protein